MGIIRWIFSDYIPDRIDKCTVGAWGANNLLMRYRSKTIRIRKQANTFY